MGTEIKQCRLPVFVCSTYFCTCVLWLTQSVVPYSYGLATTELVLGYRYWNKDALLRLCLTDGAEDFSEARMQRVEWPDRDPVESSHRPRAHHQQRGQSGSFTLLCSDPEPTFLIVLILVQSYSLEIYYYQSLVGEAKSLFARTLRLKGSSSNWILHRSDYRLILQSDFIKRTGGLIIRSWKH
jgi:hypothetical protein